MQKIILSAVHKSALSSHTKQTNKPIKLKNTTHLLFNAHNVPSKLSSTNMNSDKISRTFGKDMVDFPFFVFQPHRKLTQR